VRLARDFSSLALVARNRGRLEETAQLVQQAGAESLVIDADLGALAAAQAVVERAPAAFGRNDALLNIAGADDAVAKFPREAGIARYGAPEEIAELMAFLVSAGARWMTGSALRMDGGEVKSI
jgi:NAD(P)-dependent dehydrogenase (short-subunit alcohol dehydrogenase family)